ncbi:hypothetical protein Tco_0055239, partial [Tanacetum coccineum]
PLAASCVRRVALKFHRRVASVQQYPAQSSKSPQSSTEPYPSDNFQLDSGSSSTENLIESLSNTLALLTQSYKSHLPQTNNQLRASSDARKKLWFKTGKFYSLYKTQRVWKATGKLFADFGYQWRPTGKKLTLGKLDCGSQWRPTGKKFAFGEIRQLTKLSNAGRTGHAWFTGSVRFGNDHLGAIMGYGDYVMGDGVISRVYYVEGLGHNLFSVRQFCDSDLEVAF